jgi:ADP-ribose pyrophosphatase
MDAKTIFEGKNVLVKERDGWEFVERKKGKAAVAIAARTDDGKIVLVEQFRRPADARVIDFAAGLVGDDGTEGFEETARKELEEETGYRCARLERVATGPTSPGITSETVVIFVATGLERVGAGGGVGHEKITVHEVRQEEVVEWLRAREREGIQVDLKVWSGLYFLKM